MHAEAVVALKINTSLDTKPLTGYQEAQFAKKNL
jgi:hypothetical protein